MRLWVLASCSWLLVCTSFPSDHWPTVTPSPLPALCRGLREAVLPQGRGSVACLSKADKEVRKGKEGWWIGKFALFWMLASREKVDICPKADSPRWKPVRESFMNRRRRQHADIAQSALTVILKLVTGDLARVSLVVYTQLIFSSGVNLFLFLEVSSKQLRQLTSWLQSGHHVGNFSTWCSFSINSSRDVAQNIICSPWEGIKDLWLCLMTMLLLCSLLWLSSFVSPFLPSLI